MERRAQPYTIHKRPTSRRNRSIYYAHFRDPKTGRRQSAISTGCTRRDDAVRWCERHLASARDQVEHITFADYAAGFWQPDAAYATARIAHGYSCSKGYLEIAEGNTRNHLIPVWGDTRLSELTPRDLDAWIVALRREGELAPATVNKVLQALRTILEQAVADGWLKENPAAVVKPVRAESTERGILTPTEVVRLLANPAAWGDFRQYTINLFAVATGARMGEVRGLLVENVKADHVQIRHSWEEKHGLKPPKYNNIRDVPVSARVAEALGRVIAETRPETLVFYGSAGQNSPMSKSLIEKRFYQALERIGISEIERRERRITFHSHRHFLNTFYRSRGVPDIKVRMITGHRSQRMSDRYTHFRAADFVEVLEVQAALLEAPASVV